MKDIVLNNHVILGSVNAGAESFEAAIRDLEIFPSRSPDALSKVITGRFPIDEAVRLLTGDHGGIKNVVSVSQ